MSVHEQVGDGLFGEEMRIGECVYHFPTKRKGVCKGLPSGRGTVRVWIGGAIEMINQRELRRSSGMAKVADIKKIEGEVK